MKNWAHDELADDLASHLRGATDRMVWTNMQLGPSGSRRPDVYTLQKSYSRFCPMAYEVKVSVADFRRDVTSGKWQEYLNFAGGVVFAVPHGLVRKEDIPARCGLIVRHDSVWRSAKRATLDTVEDLPQSTWMKLLIDGIDRVTRSEVKQRLANPWTQQEMIRKQFGDQFAFAYRNREAALVRLQEAHTQASDELDRIQAQRLEAETKRLGSLRSEHDTLWAEIKKMAEALGCQPSVWQVQHALAGIRLEKDREALEEAHHHLTTMAKTAADAARELGGRLGINQPDGESE